MMTVRDLALVRAGDKGNTSNLAVVAESDAAYERLAQQLTPTVVEDRFSHLGATTATRYEVPSVGAFNFVLEGTLGGGVTTSLRVDAHGKSLSSLLAGTELPEWDGSDRDGAE